MTPPFAGTWRLVSQHSLYPDGRVEPSRGDQADGIIMYDAAGNMAVQLMRTDQYAAEFTDMGDLSTAMQGFLATMGIMKWTHLEMRKGVSCVTWSPAPAFSAFAAPRKSANMNLKGIRLP